jgi:hypothetical protein
MKLKATCSTLSPASLKDLILCINSGNWIPSCMVGSVFHHTLCFGCSLLGFGGFG